MFEYVPYPYDSDVDHSEASGGSSLSRRDMLDGDENPRGRRPHCA
jgi:hypothetical protein